MYRSFASNYDPLANVDDGLCCYGNDNLTINITTDNYPTETRWYITNQNGVEIDGINSGDLTAPIANYSWDVCVDLNDCYTFWIEDSYGMVSVVNMVTGLSAFHTMVQ